LPRGGGAPAAMNAANEAAVAAFLGRQIGFLDIAAVVDETLDRMDAKGALAPAPYTDVLEQATAIDRQAREVAGELLKRGARTH